MLIRLGFVIGFLLFFSGAGRAQGVILQPGERADTPLINAESQTRLMPRGTKTRIYGVPVSSIFIDLRIAGAIATVKVKHTFSAESGALNAGVFYFPLPQDSQVTEVVVYEGEHSRTLTPQQLEEVEMRGVESLRGKRCIRIPVDSIPGNASKLIEVVYRQILKPKHGVVWFDYAFGGHYKALRIPVRQTRVEFEIKSANSIDRLRSSTHLLGLRQHAANRIAGSVTKARKVNASHFRLIYATIPQPLGQDELESRGSSTVSVMPITQTTSTTAAQASSTVESNRLKELPNLAATDSLVRLTAGTFAQNFSFFRSTAPDVGSEFRFSINSGETRSNLYTIDGHDNTGIDGRPGIAIDNVDAIEMLHVLSTRGSGDVSQTGASAIGFTTRRGGREVHGTLFDYYLDRRFGALSPIEGRNGLDGPPAFKSSIYGGTVGGPIQRDRLSFFGSLEAETETARRFLDSTSSQVTPTPAGLNEMAQSFPGLKNIRDLTNRGPFSRLVGPINVLRPSTVPVLDVPIEFGQVGRLAPHKIRGYEVGGRLDFNATARDTMELRYWLDDRSADNAVGRLEAGYPGNALSRSQFTGFHWTRLVSPLTTNDLLLGFNRSGAELENVSTLDNEREALSVAIASFGLAYGQHPSSPQSHVSTLFYATNNVSHMASRHNLNLGGQLRYRLTRFQYQPGSGGHYNYPSFDAFVLDRPTSILFVAGDPRFPFTEMHAHVYIDDAWRARDNLTMSFGLSYENATQPLNGFAERLIERETNAATALFDPALSIELRAPARVERDNNNIAPRIGIAYTPRSFFGRERTVIRAGAIVSYDSTAYGPLADLGASAPNVLLAAAVPGNGPELPPFPAVLDQDNLLNLFGRDPRAYSQTLVDPRLRTPYSYRWHLAISRDVIDEVKVEAAYVATLSNRIIRLIDATSTASAVPEDQPGSSFEPAPRRLYTSSGRSSYHSFQARAEARMFKSLDGGASYGFSKLIDDVPDHGARGPYVVGTPFALFMSSLHSLAQNPLDVSRGERGLSGLHRRHSLGAHFVWAAPGLKTQVAWLEKLLNGWKASGIVEVASGAAYTPLQYFGNSSAEALIHASMLSVRSGSIRPFSSNPEAPPDAVAFSNAANRFYRFFTNSNGEIFESPTGFIIATRSGFRAGGVSEARFVYNDFSVEEAARRMGLPADAFGQTFAAGRPFGDVGRNTLIGPSLINTDFALLKSTKITEKVSVQFRAEFYNLFNHPNRGIPNFLVENAGGHGFADLGEVDAAPRRVRLGLKLIF